MSDNSSLGDLVIGSTCQSSNGVTVPFSTNCVNKSHVMDDKIWTPDVIQRVVSLVFIMIVTIIGNTVIIFVLSCTRYRKKNSRVNLFIINLAIGDLAVCFVTMTTEILFVAFGEWVLGNAACKILTYLQICTLASTTFILTSMSIDRYCSLCRPLQFHQPSSAVRAKRMCLTSWVLAFIFASPQLLIFVQTEEKVLENGHIQYECKSQGYTEPWQRKVYFTFMTTYILVIPVIIMSFCYISVVLCVWRQGKPFRNQSGKYCQNATAKNTISTAKVKTIKMTLAIIITFIACWTPYFVTTLIKIYSDYKFTIPSSVMVFAETAALLQSALNPILYGCFNIKLKHIMTDHLCPGKIYKVKTGRAYNVGASGTIVVTGKINYYLRHDSKEGSSSGGSARGYVFKENDEKCFKLKVRFITKGSNNQDSSDGALD